MRHALIAAAVIAVCGLFASVPASAQQAYYAGGPTQQGTMCQVSTGGDSYYGYWRPCPQPATVTRVTMKKKKK